MKFRNIRIISLLLVLVMILGMMPGLTINAFAAEQTATNGLEGKTISILGASMSTYTGISNNPDYNSTIGNNAVYYTEGKLGVYKNDTWWMQAANDLGLRLLVNNSWSGSSLLYERNGTVGAYVDRCVQLHNNEGEMPDIIAIQMGTNDFQYYKGTLGTADIDYAALITENADGSFTYAEPTTSLEAAAIVLHKISIRYPDAEVYYLNISQRIDGTDELIRSFNAELKQVVEHFGAHIVDIYGSAITMADFDTYIGDGRVHPNCLGMDAYTEAFKRALLANTAYEVDTHTVSFELDGVTADYGDDKIVVSGDAFSCKLTAEDGKELSVSVTKGGEDITDTAYENGTISIESVTDDVVITAEATAHKSQNYRWEFDGTDLACVSGGNPLTKDSGTTADGVFSKTSYTLKNEVVLMHDLPWIIEWKCEGTFQNSGSSSGARIFTSDNVNDNYNARYIFKSNTNGIIAMGEKDTKGSHNYGIALADHGIDWTELHTYRLENHIAADGSNMIYLYVDGEEIGPMNQYYIGTKDQNTTSDWLSGKDFVFPYMGTDTHGFTNASIDYIQVWEGGHSHTYENGICTVCGDSFAGKKVSILSHSMSTYAGVSNNTAANSTIGSNDVYYTEGRLGVYQKDTWWQQVIDALDMELLVNNSWSGSCVFMPRKGEASVGYGDRAVNLHNDYTGEEPDIIFVYLGCNDFAYYKDTFGEAADVNYATLITDNGDGTFTYAAPATTCEAYAIMLHKVANRYPDAEIYCMTSTARRETDYTGDSYPDAGQPTLYSAQLQKIAKYFGYPVIDLENAIPKDVEIFDKYIGDKRAHANALGMDQISNEVLSVMLGTEVEICHVTSEDGIVAEQALLLGGSYSADVTLRPGYSIKVTMDGKDITSEAYQNGKITITKVTGDICVRAYIVHTPKDYLWNLENGELVSTGEYENNATKLSGTVTDGLLSNSCYAFATAIVLQHDLPWVLEWKIAGNWGGMLLSSTHTEKTANIQYITRTKGGQVCFGTWLEEKHRNYGVDLSALDNNAHVYRLENHIDADGSNMIWIYVDGTEIGPMNNYYIGSAYQSTDSAWVSGRDFVFSHVGTGGYPLNNCALDYMRVIECNHTYENGICTACGAEHPNLANYEGKVISILGDSISTFAGYIPTADGFNLEHYARYPQDDLLTDVNETWWMQVLTALDAKLGINESWRSTEVYNYIDAEVNSSYDGTKACMASVTRIQNLGSNGTPDVILLFGGTNDITQSRPVGTFDPFTAPTEVDLTSVKWDTVADAYVDAIMRMQYYYPEAQIVAMLPFDRNSQGTAKVNQYNSLFISICEHYGVPYVDLRECGISNADLPDGTHPDATGMDYITEAVLDTLLDDMEMEAGEHIVHSVTHNLNGAESSLGYYKGITHGKSFVTTITGENVTVSVTMGGADITDTAYANGVVTIAAVTGDLVITAQGRVKPIYEDHLQQLPENLCCSTNLWFSLVPENTYYTGSAWGNVSGNSVYSITIPIAAGDQILATSFQKSGTNGGSRNGIRLTWFDESGVLESVSPDNVYTEFSANGYLTAPEGVVAVNVVMWNGNESNEVYILNRGHIYENGICTGCGAVDPNWNSDVDVVFINEKTTIPHTVNGRTVTVDYDLPCRVGYWDEAQQRYIAIPAVEGEDGGYSFTAPSGAEEVLLVITGDTNGDGRVTASDIARLNAHLKNKTVLTAKELFAADVNHDGRLDDADKSTMSTAILGITSLEW